jgi:hypothetical protein
MSFGVGPSSVLLLIFEDILKSSQLIYPMQYQIIISSTVQLRQRIILIYTDTSSLHAHLFETANCIVSNDT